MAMTRLDLRLLLVSIAMALLAGASFARAQPAEAPFSPQSTAQTVTIGPDGTIQTAARQLLFMEYETGEVLYEKDGYTPMKPASMAKLMTTAVLFEKLKTQELGLDTLFTVSETAWRISVGQRAASSKMFLEVGKKVRLEDLLRGIIIQSGNDATLVAAEGVAGSEEAFAGLMNETAQKIGLKSSTFRNSSGLPHPEQWVTAHDLALLARYIISSYPQQYRYYAEREFKFAGIVQANRNPLLARFPGADGMKTGHTAESGYGLVGTAIRDGRRIIMVINGLTSEAERAAEASRLMEIAFNEFRSYALFSKGDQVGEAEVFAGVNSAVPLLINRDVRVTLRRDARAGLKAVIRYDGPLEAPVARGQAAGVLEISAPGMDTISVPLSTGKASARVGILDTVQLGLKDLLAGGTQVPSNTLP